MAIELPSGPDVLDERLASLEDPLFAEVLVRANPAHFPHAPPQTERDVLVWTTRGLGRALIAATAALSLAAGYLGSELLRGHTAAPVPAHRSAAVALPLRHAPPIAQHRAATHRWVHAAPAAPAPALARHGATAPLHSGASGPVRHEVPTSAPRRATLAPVPHHAVAHLAFRTAPHPALRGGPHVAPQTAAGQLAAWESAHPHASAAAEPAPRTQPRSEPASATETATATASGTGPASAAGAPGGAPDPGQGGGVKNPPTNPGGGWSERLPGGGTLGGTVGPVIGVPRDSCTPRGGRTGIVMEAISVLMSSRH